MQREHVDSSSVNSVGYDAGRRVLELEFRNGGVYQYLDVSRAEYEELVTADSVGRYVNLEIKPKHPYRKVR